MTGASVNRQSTSAGTCVASMAPDNHRGPSFWANLLEPAALVDTFLKHPPMGFEPLPVASHAGVIPAFVTDFDPSLTLDPPIRRLLRRLPYLGSRLKLRTLFVGTTITEYCPYPGEMSPDRIVPMLRQTMQCNGARAIIFKDMPFDSPLLDIRSRELATRCMETLAKQGFIPLSGQLLAYIPLDFSTVDELLSRMSRIRRKSIRRKLRAAQLLNMATYHSGDAWFQTPGTISKLYALYLNVYEHSNYQFDRLPEDFFRDILLSREHNGVLFTYRYRGSLIGFNLCFVHNNNLIDKYVGFKYPEARNHNLYYVSWFHSIEYALENALDNFIAGCSSPEIKEFLGARFTPTQYAVYLSNPVLRWALRRFSRFFEMDGKHAMPSEDTTVVHQK